MSSGSADSELKARHRAMWASGDYPSMVETFLLPLGPRLIEACGVGPGVDVLDVAAGTGNASIPAAKAGATATASDLTPELFDAGRRRAEAEGVELEWIEADAENLPFEHPRDYGEHFKAKYGPTIAARNNASRDGREAELDDALDRFCDEWNLGTGDRARFEQEYLIVVGTRV